MMNHELEGSRNPEGYSSIIDYGSACIIRCYLFPTRHSLIDRLAQSALPNGALSVH